MRLLGEPLSISKATITEDTPPPSWQHLPIPLLINVLSKLPSIDIAHACAACKHWRSCAFDQALWKTRFLLDFQMSWLQHSGVCCWYNEYRTIKWTSANKLTQTLGHRRSEGRCAGDGHRDEVLHIAFAPDATVFASCSKDATVKIWWCGDCPSDLEDVSYLCEVNMKTFLKWEYTQFSQFNQESTLLLVSGVILSTDQISGEIAIFDVDVSTPALHFRSRVLNRPYDVFGCCKLCFMYDNNHILNGELMNLTSNYSVSHIWLCKASQDTHTERTAVLAPLSNNVRMVKVCDIVSPHLRANLMLRQYLMQLEKSKVPGADLENIEKEIERNLIYLDTPEQFLIDRNLDEFESGHSACKCENCARNHEMGMDGCNTSLECTCYCICHSEVKDRLMLFAHGHKAYIPHQIGFKLIRGDQVLQRLNADIMPDTRRKAIQNQIRLRRERLEEAAANAPNLGDQEDGNVNVAEEEMNNNDDDLLQPYRDYAVILSDLERQFDSPDYTIELNGHILSTNLSHDNKLLYVNVRPWTSEEESLDTLHLPEIKEGIEMRVIDIDQMKLLDGPIYSGHIGYTPNERCFVIYADSNQSFIASGSEDKCGVLWSLSHGCIIGTLLHEDVVNCVAFNPLNPDMCVSASDDYTIKVWRSKRSLYTTKSNNS